MNLSDRQCLLVLRKLHKHWKGGIPKYVPAALRDQKHRLDHLYTKVKLDSTTNNYFVDSNGTILTRWLVYCTDLESLMYSKELLEGETQDDFLEVVDVDDGKTTSRLNDF